MKSEYTGLVINIMVFVLLCITAISQVYIGELTIKDLFWPAISLLAYIEMIIKEYKK